MVTATEVQTLEFRIVRQVKTAPPLTFTVEMRYYPEDEGYIAECLELRAFAFGETVDEAIENLLDVIILIAATLVEDHKQFAHLRDPRLPHAQFVFQLGDDETKLRKLLGL
jgi:predicted RNase H-like HicB family nuclease